LLALSTVLFIGCDKEPNTTVQSDSEIKNTLTDEFLGDQSEWGLIGDYFNLENNIDLKFQRYDAASYSTDILFDPAEDTLRFRTFTEFEAIESNSATTYIVLDTTDTFSSSLIDSLWVFSTLFKNVDSLVWNVPNELDINNQYYTKKLSKEYVRDSAQVFFDDIFDSLIVYTQIDSSNSTGAAILDTGVIFLDTTTYKQEQIIDYLDNEINAKYFEVQGTQINAENLMGRINTDCNDNGQWDGAEVEVEDINGNGSLIDVLFEFTDIINSTDELRFYYNRTWDEGEEKLADYNGDGDSTDVIFEFIDRGNGLMDVAEPSLISGSNNWSKENVFQDRNCNGEWEAVAELNSADGYVESDCDVIGGTWMTVGADTFCDVGNYRYDGAEVVTENPDGVSDTTSDELYSTSEIMSSMLVDYLDPQNPRIMPVIFPGDSLTTRWGVKFTNLIEEFTLYDTVSYQYENIGAKKTVYSHPIIEYFPDNSGKSFYIAKAEWSEDGIDQYSYHMFRDEGGNIAKLVYPGYFKPYGYWDPSQFSEYFWFDTVAVVDTVFYTYDGYLRDGEQYSKEKVVSLAVPDELYADYLIEEAYQVMREAVTIPMDNTTEIPASECFKITRTEKMTMLGTGMTFNFVNETWLGKGRGIIKEQIEYQWYGLGLEGLSRLELIEDNSGELGRSFFNTRTLNPKDFENIEELGNDPFIPTKSGVIQRVGY